MIGNAPNKLGSTDSADVGRGAAMEAGNAPEHRLGKRKRDGRHRVSTTGSSISTPFRQHQHKTVNFRDDWYQDSTLAELEKGAERMEFSSGLQRDRPSLKRKAQELLPVRKALPVYGEAERIREALRSPGQDALLLVGETGSGKSTQVPQILITEPWAQRRTVRIDGKPAKVGGCIAITEPRRVAAISLARRVAEEMGTPLGSASPASQVGYSVRFDNSTSPSIRIKFLTEGMLLQEMLSDPWLKDYSAVLVDEVHERGVNVDLVMGFLKQMQDGDNRGRGGIPLKVVVMSATADMELVDEFLKATPRSKADDKRNGYDRPDSESSWSGLSDGASRGNAGHDGILSSPGKSQSKASRVSTCHIKGRQYPVNIIYTPSPVPDFIDAALNTIFKIHVCEPLPGDILVFLTGQETVENLLALCLQFSTTMPPSVPKLFILPLFAALPQTAQQLVFQPTPPGRRKVILSTNLAETSVTVPGVRYVIDCGKHKRKQFRSRLSLDSLLVKPISKSSAKQRAGRAGREAPGTCYRLYPEREYLKLEQDTSPEILRCDLSQAILMLKARGVDEIWEFPLLTPPPREALEKALMTLLQLSALEPATGNITEVGKMLARFPLSPRLGRVLLAASSYAVVPEVIDIISALSVESVFLQTNTEDASEQAAEARRELFRREGDHLTLLATVQAYIDENADRRAWCEKRFISHRAMKAVADVRKQLLDHAKRAGMLQSSTSSSASSSGNTGTKKAHQQHRGDNTASRTAGASSSFSSSAATIIDDDLQNEPKSDRILKSFLRAFYTSTASLVPDGSYQTLTGRQTVAIHPSSVLFGRGKVEAIMYHEFVYTNRAYARRGREQPSIDEADRGRIVGGSWAEEVGILLLVDMESKQ